MNTEKPEINTQPRVMPVHKKKQSKKRDRHRNKKLAQEGITWNTLSEIALSITSTIQYLDSLARSFRDNKPDQLKKSLHCQELFKGYYKLLNEAAGNIRNLMLLHSVRDSDNNPIKDKDGILLLRKGKIHNNRDINSATEIFLEYVNEMDALQPLTGSLLLDLAAAFDVGNKIENLIKETSTTINTLTNFNSNDITKSIMEYHKILNSTIDKVNEANKEKTEEAPVTTEG